MPEHDDEVLKAQFEAHSKMLRDRAKLSITAFEIAEGVLEAANRREDSYVKQTDPDMVAAGFLGDYTLTIYDAVEAVFMERGIPQVAHVAHISLEFAWNDVIEWAERVTGREQV